MSTDPLAPAYAALDYVSDPLVQYGRNVAWETAVRLGLSPLAFTSVFERLINQESGWNPYVGDSSAGARGIAQLMPVHWGDVDANDPYAALAYAANYLGTNIQRYGGDYTRGVSAYNAGPGTVDAIADLPDNLFVSGLPGETQTYISNILGVNMANTTGNRNPRGPQYEGEGEPPPTTYDPNDPTTWGETPTTTGKRYSVHSLGGELWVFDNETGQPVGRYGGEKTAGGMSIQDMIAFRQQGIENANERERIGISGGNLAETRRGNNLSATQQIIADLINEQQLADARMQNSQSNTLDAAQWALPPGEEYLPGAAPGDPLVSYGLQPVRRAAPMAFNPRAQADINDPEVRAALAELRQMAGIG